ncbi:hypothetical protein [Natronobacterium texcoconense]|uniref:Uncharacterized protein n=1 Tax=Natronobacterium texcoconense TaxID=1095778 RepID=A0A1H1CCM9_NATTX|nr:hypothetical protein [Natronobacterium texcoconense]SDQ61924.1 hypothetical protein SAMN04489842_1356 [Natronobacterium texcoconense]
MQSSTRRRVLAASVAGTVGLAGCLSETGDDETTDDSASNTDETEAEAPSVDWESVPEFRRWLTDEPQRAESNRRFDYVDTVTSMFISPAIGFVEEFDDDITGSLVHDGHEIHLGDFDRDAVVDAAASFSGEAGGPTDGIEYERTETYEGYTLFTDGLAVGEDAILWNLRDETATAAIDTRLDRDIRLEAAEPLFTAVFDRLPDGIEVVGQYGPPAGGDVSADEILLWGGTRESLESTDMTWIFVAEDEASVTDELLAELETVAVDPELEVDGQFVRIDGSMGLG